MLDSMDREDRLRLMKFVCSFAWADLEVADDERNFVRKLVEWLELDDEEQQQVQKWLEVPPPPEEVDPAEIPHSHRQLFIDTARAMIVADGRVDEDEAESLALLEMLAK
jgi:uncharacterized tellurite resistance protein B-like protein